MSRFEMIDENDYTFDDQHDVPDAEDFDTAEPIDMDECEYCGDPSDLYPVESVDVTVGHRETQWLCSKCKPRRKP